MRCHYEVVGVERDALDDDIKRAFRRRALQVHPGLAPGHVVVIKSCKHESRQESRPL